MSLHRSTQNICKNGMMVGFQVTNFGPPIEEKSSLFTYRQECCKHAKHGMQVQEVPNIFWIQSSSSKPSPSGARMI